MAQIEAARAGEADKGFAVVANDSTQVKESATNLRNFAGQRTDMVGQFKISIPGIYQIRGYSRFSLP